MGKETPEARRTRILEALERRENRNCDTQAELMPQRVFHWNGSDQERQLLESTLRTPDIAFMVKVAALCSLPRTNPGRRERYIRANGE